MIYIKYFMCFSFISRTSKNIIYICIHTYIHIYVRIFTFYANVNNRLVCVQVILTSIATNVNQTNFIQYKLNYLTYIGFPTVGFSHNLSQDDNIKAYFYYICAILRFYGCHELLPIIFRDVSSVTYLVRC